MTDSTAATAIVECGGQFSVLGMAHGGTGNISVRSDDGTVTLTPTGSSLGNLVAADLTVLDAGGRHIAGRPGSKETGMHTAIYARRGDVGAVVHLHAPNAVAVSCLDPWSSHSAVPPLTPYYLMKCGATPLAAYAPPGSSDLFAQTVSALGPANSCLMSNHGLVAVGSTLDRATEAALELERTCELYMRAVGHGLRVLTESQIQDLRDQYGVYWPSPSTGL